MVLFYSVLHEKGGREKNEDSLALHRCETRAGDLTMALVCDGMGGEQAGELASGYVVERLSVWFYDELPESLRRGFNRGKIQRSLQRALFRIHEELRHYGLEHALRCGTTMTMLLLLDRRYISFQCGDSMAYRLGRAIRGVVKSQGNGQGLKQCIGIGRFVSPQMRCGRLSGRSALLLLSDGLTKKLNEQDYLSALSPAVIKQPEDAKRALRSLVRIAEKRGEQDNMSALYLRCG